MARALLVVIACLLAFGAQAESPVLMLRLAEPAGVGRLLMPEDAGAATPLVILLPDALGEEIRTDPYVDSLLARGIASLTFGFDDGIEVAAAPRDAAASVEAAAIALAWARQAGVAPGRIGLIGFGAGGRAALLGGQGLPAAALYPGCAGLVLPGAGEAIILQGAAAAEGCASLSPPSGVTLRLLPGAGHGWDAQGFAPLLLDPAGSGRIRATPNHDVTLLAAEALADWFEARLAPHRRRAAR